MVKISYIKFINNRLILEEKINDLGIDWLHEASSEIEAQTKRNTRVDTGQLKSSWKYNINEEKLESTIGSPLENAIWEEFGTGEYALNGDGRKTPWVYKDIKGTWHYTHGKRPSRAFYNAFNNTKGKITRAFKIKFRELNK